LPSSIELLDNTCISCIRMKAIIHLNLYPWLSFLLVAILNSYEFWGHHEVVLCADLIFSAMATVLHFKNLTVVFGPCIGMTVHKYAKCLCLKDACCNVVVTHFISAH
jgi:hypothetical protein